MIEISLGQLRAPAFATAYQKLMNTAGLEPKIAYHVMRVSKLLEGELKTANETFEKLIKEWAEFKNENGETMWQVPKEKLEDWNKTVGEFHANKVQIDKHKLKLVEIERAALTPADYMALEPILSTLELVEGGDNGNKKESN